MPEGPECRKVTDKLRKHIRGKKLVWMEFFLESTSLKYYNMLKPQLDVYDNLFPVNCLDVICRGKQIFFFFENHICMYGGLGMEGHWYFFDNYFDSKKYCDGKSKIGVSYPKFNLSFGKSITNNDLICDMAEHFLWYDDKRNFGNFAITTWVDAFQKMEKIGPDLLAVLNPIENIHTLVQRHLPKIFFESATPEKFCLEIKSSRRQNMGICKFLMEQTYFSGIGNYLKCEILYRAKISPFRNLGTLTDPEINRLYVIVLNTISQAYKCGGLTHGTFLDPDMEKGTFPVFVYKRTGLDSNGYQIQQTKIDGRGTYYVPEIQV